MLARPSAMLEAHARRFDAGYESRVPPDGAIVDIGGTTFHYLDRGTGSPIVLIHGRNFHGMPICIMFATEDGVLDPDVHGAGLVDQNPNIRFDLIPGGHMFPVTRPSLTAAWIEAAV